MAATTQSQPQWVANQSSQCASSSRHISRKDRDYDRFYGHRFISELSESVISALFACPLDSSSSVGGPAVSSSPTPRLAEFIAYALHRTRLPDEITFQALFLLRRLKSRFPAARGSSGHRLFISALMLASKSSCDDTYSNKSWTIVSQGLFSLREVNQMERELFGYLGYKVNVEMEELQTFTILLKAGDIASVIELGVPSSTTPTIKAEEETPRVTPTKAHHSPSLTETRRASVSGYPNSNCPSTVYNMASVSTPAFCADSCAQSATSYPARPQYSMHSAYAMHAHQLAAAASNGSVAHLSPSMVSSSSRHSFSSTSGYSTTPSPTSLSQDESSSSRASPNTPSTEFDASPWTDDGKAQFSSGGEPAGTYENQYHFYEHLKSQQYYSAHVGAPRGESNQHAYST